MSREVQEGKGKTECSLNAGPAAGDGRQSRTGHQRPARVTRPSPGAHPVASLGAGGRGGRAPARGAPGRAGGSPGGSRGAPPRHGRRRGRPSRRPRASHPQPETAPALRPPPRSPGWRGRCIAPGRGRWRPRPCPAASRRTPAPETRSAAPSRCCCAAPTRPEAGTPLPGQRGRARRRRLAPPRGAGTSGPLT